MTRGLGIKVSSDKARTVGLMDFGEEVESWGCRD